MANVLTPESPPRKKPTRNEPCWCGSGAKYKKCHLETDQTKAREEYQARLETEGNHGHPEHPGCKVYHPISTGTPAHLRSDFNRLVREMRSQGATLMHVAAPRVLARDESGYVKALEMLRDHGITAEFAEDPTGKELGVAQAYFNCIFGEGAYRILPVSASFQRYPETWRRTAIDGVTEVGVARGDGLAGALFEEKETEWLALGNPTSPGLLVEVAMAGDLVSELINGCVAIAEEHSILEGWGSIEHVLIDLTVMAGITDGVVEPPPPFTLGARIAIGLALPNLLGAQGNSVIEALHLSDGGKSLLADVMAELRADSVATEIVRAAGEDWRTGAGFRGWVDSIPSGAKREAGIPEDEPITAGVDGKAEAAPAEQVVVAPEKRAGAVQKTVAHAPGPDLFSPLTMADESAQVGIDEAGNVLHGRFGHLEELRLRVSELEAQTETARGELRGAEREIQDMEDGIDGLLLQARHIMAEALRGLLVEAAPRVSAVEHSWLESGMPAVAPLTALTAEQARDQEFLNAYAEQERSGALASMNAVLRQALETELAEVHKRETQADTTTGEAKLPETYVPVAVALSMTEGRLHLSAALPFDGVGPDRLGQSSPATLLAAIATNQIATFANEVGSQDGEREVEVIGFGDVTVVDVAVPYAGPADDLAEEEQLYEMELQDAFDGNPMLRAGGIAVQCRSVSATLLEKFSSGAGGS